MKILLDEGAPVQVVALLQRVLRQHKIDHVDGVLWKSKADTFLYQDAKAKGYDVVVTNDAHQMSDPEECRAVRRAGIHRVAYQQRPGLKGLAIAVASIIAAMPDVVEELEHAESQRLVAIYSISTTRKRYKIVDPRRDPPRYWGR